MLLLFLRFVIIIIIIIIGCIFQCEQRYEQGDFFTPWQVNLETLLNVVIRICTLKENWFAKHIALCVCNVSAMKVLCYFSYIHCLSPAGQYIASDG